MQNEYFDADILRSIETLDPVTAKTTCVELIQKSKTKAAKKQHLLRDISSTEDPKEMSRIMWNIMLSGMGLSTLNSQWQKQYG